MDIDRLVKRVDFSHPFFADFILHKYADIKETDPESARKIEDRVFTPGFVKSILTSEARFLKARVLRVVPPHCFADLTEVVLDCFIQSRDQGALKQASEILMVTAPSRYLEFLESMFRRFLGQTPCRMENFYWLTHLHELPDALAKTYMEQSVSLFKANQDGLSGLSNYAVLVENLLTGALATEHSWSLAGAKLFLENRIRELEQNDEQDETDFCFDVFYKFAVPVNGKKDGFELEWYYSYKDMPDHGAECSAVLDQLYAGSGFQMAHIQALFESAGDVREQMAAIPFSHRTDTFFQGRLIRELVSDSDVAERLEAAGLSQAMVGVWAALLWQMNRDPGFDLSGWSEADLIAYLNLDFHPLPFMDRVRIRLEQLAPEDQARTLIQAMAEPLKRVVVKDGGASAATNVLELMAASGQPGYLPLFAQALTWDDPDLGDEFYDLVPEFLVKCGDEAFAQINPLMNRIPAFRLLETLSVVRKLATPAAEEFLMQHFDRFMAESKGDTLDTCQKIVSRKALDRLAHKVGKNQKGIDELFVIVNAFEGGVDVDEILNGLIPQDQLIEEAYAMMDSNEPSPELDLELVCSRCGDISTYPCRNVIASNGGGIYVAQEMTCINCGKICEFDLTVSGQMMVQMEMMRTMSGKKDDDPPVKGAITLVDSHAMGRPMSIADAVAAYKEKIRQHPKKAEFHIGLGNIYRSMNQPTLAMEQYKTALVKGPFYIEAYLSLAQLEETGDKPEAALEWLEKGRPFLKRPLICKDAQASPDQIFDEYMDLHLSLLRETGAEVLRIKASEFMAPDKSATKVGRNEKCPCGSGKKYKKCCMGKA